MDGSEVTTAAVSTKTAPYTGRYRFGIDHGRISLPARWRQEGMPVEFVVSLWPIGMNRHLLVMPMSRWEGILSLLTQRSIFDPTATAGLRQLGAGIGYLSVDRAGRVALPEGLAKEAGIGKEVELFGLLDRFEIWNPERFSLLAQESQVQAVEFFREVAHETRNVARPQS
jgi:MraZ protein